MRKTATTASRYSSRKSDLDGHRLMPATGRLEGGVCVSCSWDVFLGVWVPAWPAMCRCMNISFPAEAGPSVLQSPTRSRSRSRPGATSVRGKPLRYLQRAGGPSEWQLVPSAIYLRCAVRSSQIGRSFSRAASPHRVPKPKVWQQHAAQVDVSRLRGGSGFTRAKGALPEPRSRVSAGSTKPVAKARPLQLIAAAHRRRRARSSFAIAASSPAMAEITFARPSADGKSGRFIRVVLRWATFLLMSRRPGRDMKDLSWLSSEPPLACGQS